MESLLFTESTSHEVGSQREAYRYNITDNWWDRKPVVYCGKKDSLPAQTANSLTKSPKTKHAITGNMHPPSHTTFQPTEDTP